MKKSEKQAFYLSPRSGTPGRFPDPRSPLTKKRKGSQGRRDCFLKRPKASPPSKHRQIPELERAQEQSNWGARDHDGTSPICPRDPQDTSSRAPCTGPDQRPSLTQSDLPTSVSRRRAHYSPGRLASLQPL